MYKSPGLSSGLEVLLSPLHFCFFDEGDPFSTTIKHKHNPSSLESEDEGTNLKEPHSSSSTSSLPLVFYTCSRALASHVKCD